LLDNVYLYNIDDLKSVAEENLQRRSNEAEKAEEIVRVEARTFVRWLDSLEQVPTITALRQRFEDIRRKELEKSLAGNLKNLSGAQRAALEDMTAAMINKLLHAPISRLKRNSGDEDEDSVLYVAALKKLFDLEEK
jgi:glutamyl-tRNA reductase